MNSALLAQNILSNGTGTMDKIPFNATAPPATNPGRAGTMLGVGMHHPVANRLPTQWHDASNLNLTQAGSMHGHANDLMSLSMKTHDTTKSNNIAQYQSVHDAFTTKVQTSAQLVDILEERIRSVTTSIQRTQASLGALQTAHRAKETPLNLCVYRQTTRAKRPQREMIRDPFEIALEEEKETLLSAQDRLSQAMRNTEQTIKCLNDSLKELSHDHEVKTHSLQIDKQCQGKSHSIWPAVTSTGVPNPKQGSEASAPYAGWHAGAEDKRQQDTLERNNCAKEKESHASQLRDDNDVLIAATTQECLDARNNVETKMRERIAEVQTKRRDLEMSIADTQQKIEAMTQCRALTDSEIRSHEEPENILKHRMELRTTRHTEENISDPVTTEMLEQQHSLKQSRAMLDRRKEEERQSMAMLLKTKQDLQADLADKTTALHLDLECQKSTGSGGSTSRESALMKNMFLR
eukprot:gnl/MRDRNA2_/MRDRNA2_99499_c0_seq1.p1 gnl/MRDRNA2_/MRDRNA2_99499_c0~~gnl/MRDRNA2_/MRDRNA2_99499_c0_seq1.p1  ORF type:complete len:464 (+),score=95.45 gnl/MRDRNA2_/MRDRNA2_99499_c0_seq1:99-1490(+)